jgi:hypothetical protein
MSKERPLHLIEIGAQIKEAALVMTGAAFFTAPGVIRIPLVLSTASVSGTAVRHTP